MLGKLLKYEIKATSRWFLPLYVAIIFSAIINKFLFVTPIVNKAFEQNNSFVNIMQGIISSVSMFLYVALFFGLFVATLIVVIQRFYKSLLGDEGYLMFTIPVKAWQNILNKLLVSMLWTFTSTVIGFGSILILVPKEELKQLPYVVSDAFFEINQTLGAGGIVLLIIFAILALIVSVMEIYTAISLGHLFNKYKLLLSFAMYLGLQTVAQFLALFIVALSMKDINKPYVTDLTMQIGAPFRQFFMIANIILVLYAAGYFFLTNYLLEKKLNLE